MKFKKDDRVIATAPIGAIPAGSTGTVTSGGPVTSNVRFDGHTNVVVVPNPKLALAGGSVPHAEASFGKLAAAMSPADPTAELPPGFIWFAPRVRAPRTASVHDIIAVPTVSTLSVLFEDAEVSLTRRRQSGAWFGLIEFPVSGGPAKISGQLRGAAVQGKEGNTTILVTIGAMTNTISVNGEFNGTITGELTATADAGQSIVPIAVSILASRQSTTDESLIAVDSLDLVAES